MYANKDNYNNIILKKEKAINWLNLIIFFLFLSIFSFSNVPILPLISNFAFFILSIFSFLVLIIKKKYDVFETHIILLFFILIFLKIIFFNLNQISRIAQLLIILSIIFTIRDVYNIESNIKTFIIMSFCILIIAMLDLVFTKDNIHFYFLGSMNTFSGVVWVILLTNLLLLKYKSCLLLHFNILISILFLFLIDSRTPLLSFLIMIFLFYPLIKLFCKTQKSSNVFFFVFLIIMFVSIIFYTNIENFKFYSYINQISNYLFNKNIDSGRPQIWKNIFYSMKNDWFLGKGTYVGDYSAHNQFIHIYAEMGILGLLVFIGILFLIWNEYSKFSNDKIIKFCMMCLLGIILYNSFEVALIQNKFSLGCFQWIILSLGLARVKFLNLNKNVKSIYLK